MDTTVIQIPIAKSLRDSALEAAHEAGFSSLQDLLRLLISKVSRREISISVTEWPAVKLSKKNERRYLKMTEDFKAGKNWYQAKDIDDLMRQLHADKLQ
ncbi:hypothetical protein A2721_00280 [Candidatus Gottesmanbacteria bacterium RIFCSPHIGHO2_01_FULL_47_48]|uniref:Uncharacterized protein n=1 Tax=Candidatus Gottesmanbacteria bacterium RIFCSPHIGHO2_01_FULL_47_48 TaxID=1798381 RepID=A0A1F6A3Q7_9BACT|nr:MAG: hypothetical protein A2721_00280 [Candidatus Gottesmanbacteria bacterium RIFCSPHIGHO2_01_FULL_47_48]